MTKNAVVVSTTFYDKSEGGSARKKLAREFTREVVGRGYDLVIVDGGTDVGNFAKELTELGANVYMETQKGLGNSRREAVEHAYNHSKTQEKDFIVWSEPEKASFPESLDFLVGEMDNLNADLIVPSRESMETYPIAQVHSETFGNQRHTDYGYVDIHRKPLDTFFGPKIWRREATGSFQVFGHPLVSKSLSDMRIEELQRRYGIELNEEQRRLEERKAFQDLMRTDHMQHMPVCLMVLEGRRVLSVPVEYTHPQEQTELEERTQAEWNAKRLMQLNALDEQFRLVGRIHEQGILDEELQKMLERYK